jgi:ABC-type transport system substrate-binding protein
VRAATLIIDQLKRLGIEAKPVPVDFGLFQERTGRHRFDAAIMNWNEDPSPSGIRQVWVTSAYREANYGGYSNPKFDALVSQAMAAKDTGSAHAKWREALGLINDDAPAVWLFAPMQPTAVHKRYENVTIAPDQWLATLWTWRIPPDRMIDRDRFGSPTGSR